MIAQSEIAAMVRPFACLMLEFHHSSKRYVVEILGMQRAGKFPGMLETFHGKFREF